MRLHLRHDSAFMLGRKLWYQLCDEPALEWDETFLCWGWSIMMIKCILSTCKSSVGWGRKSPQERRPGRQSPNSRRGFNQLDLSGQEDGNGQKEELIQLSNSKSYCQIRSSVWASELTFSWHSSSPSSKVQPAPQIWIGSFVNLSRLISSSCCCSWLNIFSYCCSSWWKWKRPQQEAFRSQCLRQTCLAASQHTCRYHHHHQHRHHHNHSHHKRDQYHHLVMMTIIKAYFVVQELS